ncbi:hypothetical protein M0R45_036334 [Rubus argutus]|uniref:Pentatricopeptide repeat-containing protein n=1 Tax=Rubus argutus TaxID=59490 RepID=A0AAW1W060_RUBAR
MQSLQISKWLQTRLLSSLPSVTSLSNVETQLRALWEERNPKISEALSLFHHAIHSNRFPSGSASACNFLVQTLTRSRKYELAFSVYTKMTNVGIFPSFLTLSCLVSYFVNIHKPEFAPGVFGLVLKRGFQLNEYVMSLALKGLCSNDEVEKAIELFSVMGRHFVMPGSLDQAMEFYNTMIERGISGSIFTYNTLIDRCLKDGLVDKAIEFWRHVIDLGFVPNSITYGVMINGFCKIHMIRIAKGLFCKMRASGTNPTVIDYNTLMLSLCKEGSLGQARMLFQEMRTANHLPSVVSFNTIIDGTLKAGDVKSAKEMLEDMFKMGLIPDRITFSILVNRFSKLGLLDEARMCVKKMIACGLEPDAFVFDSLLKGYSSKGETEEIVNLLHQMADKGVILDKEITSTILACLCQISDDVDVMEVLPTFSKETSKGTSITCNELLMKIKKSYPELKLCAA